MFKLTYFALVCNVYETTLHYFSCFYSLFLFTTHTYTHTHTVLSTKILKIVQKFLLLLLLLFLFFNMNRKRNKWIERVLCLFLVRRKMMMIIEHLYVRTVCVCVWAHENCDKKKLYWTLMNWRRLRVTI